MSVLIESYGTSSEERNELRLYLEKREATIIEARVKDELYWSLSPRERQVMGLIAEGRSGPEIARILGLAKDTVNQYQAAVRLAFSVTSTRQLLARLRYRGLI